jgi:hypothetical protein
VHGVSVLHASDVSHVEYAGHFQYETGTDWHTIGAPQQYTGSAPNAMSMNLLGRPESGV